LRKLSREKTPIKYIKQKINTSFPTNAQVARQKHNKCEKLR
jgi:hypothetical protein